MCAIRAISLRVRDAGDVVERGEADYGARPRGAPRHDPMERPCRVSKGANEGLDGDALVALRVPRYDLRRYAGEHGGVRVDVVDGLVVERGSLVGLDGRAGDRWEGSRA